jgi:antitoxin component HigA of HigAB toxin-antitoxin module
MQRCKVCNRRIVKEYYEKSHGTDKHRQERQSTLYKYIKHLKTKGYTLKDIAAETGLDTSSISYYLNGKRKVGMNAVRKFERKAKQIDRENAER